MVTRKVFFRPHRSPSRPKTIAPNGRTANPAANAIRAKIYPVVSFTPEKNWAVMIAASDPYR